MDASPRTIVKISGPADILGVVPHRVGFHPAESIVVVCLHGQRRRDGLLMRLDLGPPEHDDVVARDLATKAAHVKATGVVLVCYTESGSDAEALPRRHLIDGLRQRLASHDIDVVEALLVHRGRWWSYICDEPSCCPPDGTRLPVGLTPAAAHYAAEMVADGAVVLSDRDELASSIAPPRDRAGEAVRAGALLRAEQEVLAVLETDGMDALRTRTVDLLRSLVARWADGSRELSPDDAARVNVGLGVKDARDEAATLLLDADREVLLALLAALARQADLSQAAPVCTVLAWVAYANGQGALANVAVERALDADPGYEMARLIEDAMARMIEPSAIRAVTRDVRRDLRSAEEDPAGEGSPGSSGPRRRRR